MSVPFTDAPPGSSLDAQTWIATMSDQGDHYEVCAGCVKQTAWVNLGPRAAL